MKKYISLLLIMSMLLLNLLTACGKSDEDGSNNDADTDSGVDKDDTSSGDNVDLDSEVKISENFVIAYNPYDVAESLAATDFALDFKEKFDINLKKKDYTKGISELEIKIGTHVSRDDYKAARTTMSKYATSGIGVALIRASEGGLTVTGMSADALKVAIDYVFSSVLSESGSYSATVDELIIFDAIKYSKNGELVGYSLDDISGFSDAYGFFANGNPIEEFDPKVTEYTVNVTFAEGYPDITVSPLAKGATVEYDPPTDANNGVATVTITSENGKNTSVYKINVNMNYSYAVDASIVNKGGKAGTVSFVIDDGVQSTASFVVQKMFKKYPDLVATFAVKVNALATLKTTTDTDGKEIYVTDYKGDYVYTPKTDNVNFWLDVLKTGKAEVVSHSYTHMYWGENDDGGSFVYTKNDGTSAVSKEFPKGSVTMELKASAQIVRELLGVNGYSFVKPGVGAKLSQYYFDLLESCGTYIAARNTGASPKNPTAMVNYATDFAYVGNRFNVRSYMIEHYNTSARKATDINSAPFECLTADIDYWTDYIDAAANTGGFACFCLHDIEPNDYVGSNHHIYQAQADMLFGYACERGDLWIATFDDAMRYYNEWSTATIEAIAFKNESITVRLTDKEDNSIYDMPLTVKLDVPDGWEKIAVEQGGERAEYGVIESESGNYAYVDITPDAGDALVKPVFDK